MAKSSEYKRIFKLIIDALDNASLSRNQLIECIAKNSALSNDEQNDNSFKSKRTALRSISGAVINDMERKGIIGRTENGLYRKTEEKIIAIRIEECEERIVSLISESPLTKAQIRKSLVDFFGTNKTETTSDDNRLFTYTGQILKKLVQDGILDFDGTTYSVAPEKSALIKNHAAVLSLKKEFLSRIHSKGGEFFEYFFLNLLTKYLSRTGKTVTEGYVTGGSNDGGIDGIVKTVDSLGFRELIMVQMKNRNESITETDIRGFYGAVCAKQGSRGIFATISDFHPMAKKLLDSIDNCVGVDGDKIFSMACDTSYGINRKNGRLIIDSRII